MSHSPIPEEQQSAYQRWEMASLGEDRPLPQQRAGLRDAALAAQHAAQYAAHYEEGRQQGYESGLAEGYAAGLQQGRAQAEEERALLRQLASGFTRELANANELIAADLLRLALDVAKAMLKTALKVQPELVIPVIREATGNMQALQRPALLYLNPTDAALVTGQIGNELEGSGWRVIEDPHLERGGCRVETASNQIDASMQTRWQRIAASLGNESGWLEK